MNSDWRGGARFELYYLVLPLLMTILRRHGVAAAAVRGGVEDRRRVAVARGAAPAPAPLAARARLSAVPAAAFPGLAAGGVAGGHGFQAPAVLRHPLAHALRHPLHLHPQHFHLQYICRAHNACLAIDREREIETAMQQQHGLI
jgi:hypothetical protein